MIGEREDWVTLGATLAVVVGVAVMMEAVRILKAVGARPNRTIRVALWTGEEQGLIKTIFDKLLSIATRATT